MLEYSLVTLEHRWKKTSISLTSEKATAKCKGSPEIQIFLNGDLEASIQNGGRKNQSFYLLL